MAPMIRPGGCLLLLLRPSPDDKLHSSCIIIRSRFQIFFQAGALADLAAGRPFDAANAAVLVHAFESRWMGNHTLPPSQPVGDTVEVLATAYATYHAAPSPLEYQVHADTGVVEDGSALLAQRTWTTHVGTLAYLCRLDTRCRGFTSAGDLLRNASRTTPAPGTSLYTKL